MRSLATDSLAAGPFLRALPRVGGRGPSLDRVSRMPPRPANPGTLSHAQRALGCSRAGRSTFQRLHSPSRFLTDPKSFVRPMIPIPCVISETLGMARPEGFEPPTLGLEIRCSVLLSYERASGRSNGADLISSYRHQRSISSAEPGEGACHFRRIDEPPRSHSEQSEESFEGNRPTHRECVV